MHVDRSARVSCILCIALNWVGTEYRPYLGAESRLYVDDL
jgi:hypothetical protein